VAVLLLSGTVILLSGAVLDQARQPSPIAQHTAGRYGVETLIEMLKVAGSTLIITGLISIVIDLGHWRNYFEERLRDIVVDQKYLHALEPVALDELHAKLLKAQFRGLNTEGPDSILTHFHDLQKYLAAPYRESMFSYINIKGEGSDWTVADKVDFIWCKNGNAIQKVVSWIPDESQLLTQVRITARLPTDRAETLLFEYKSDMAADPEKLKELGTGVSLGKFAENDRVHVSIDAAYKLRYFPVISWWMIHPTHRFDITIQTENYKVDTELFMPQENQVIRSAGRDFMQLHYDGWLFPYNGLIVRLFPIDDKQGATSSSPTGPA
jgi:hypothetical protein